MEDCKQTKKNNFRRSDERHSKSKKEKRNENDEVADGCDGLSEKSDDACYVVAGSDYSSDCDHDFAGYENACDHRDDEDYDVEEREENVDGGSNCDGRDEDPQEEAEEEYCTC